MPKSFRVVLALVLMMSVPIFAACSAKRVVQSEPGITPAEEEAERRLAAEREAREAMEERRLREERLRAEARTRKAREEVAERERFLNVNIHFEYDKSRLIPEAKEILRRKARWLKAHPNASVIIEGHCDERGTNAYNMALGDRRATAAKSYLVDLGIASRRMATISYGEERPLDLRHNEGAWAKNRRAQFVLR